MGIRKYHTKISEREASDYPQVWDERKRMEGKEKDRGREGARGGD